MKKKKLINVISLYYIIIKNLNSDYGYLKDLNYLLNLLFTYYHITYILPLK